ncbi:RidA family protein [Heliobacterium gestii]|uniref:RidA family protein n=1 Tax=Heliomicrobium gestii TaxID=2699 RepID=A0A845LBF9_HELGE|nr:RidA family protein [Heliomicrobium gestii]MBM7866831.1 enamine deaminase RidA (YjgF/YER057c/UK114 family) [Heliomicrobium gestii]MZP42260.1 RidA family protein [Heliomicrobium gestii]
MSVEAKLQEMGITLPEAPKPVAAYVPAVKAGDFIYTSGQIPFVNGELKYKGKVGKDLTAEKAYEAAKVCCLNCLGVIKGQVGDLNQVKKIVKVTGFVNSAAGFQGQPGVINGASELLGQLFGDKGQHARSAVGVNELPLDAAVEVEMIVQV